MPNTKWSTLTRLQLGQYGEYYAKMEFASYGYDVYTSEVDEHGVDFVAKSPVDGKYYEIQVKSLRNKGYVFVPKKQMCFSDTRLVVLVLFVDGSIPACYVIPSTEWITPNVLLVDRAYDKPGQKSRPEFGINLSQKNLSLLQKYESGTYFENCK